jgi:hypothetical protein
LAAEPQTKRDTAAARYSALASIRDDWVNRARIAGRLTLPYLIPENDDDGDGSAEQYRLPWNGIGQKGVHNLASRLMLSQLPPTEANFRFVFDEPKLAMFQRELEKAGATEEQLAGQKAEWDKTLAMFERATLRSIEISNDRVTILEALQHAIVGGNALLYDSDREGMRCFHLQHYVLLRDAMGNPMQAVICERMDRQSLPPKALEMLAGSGPPPDEGATTASRVDRTIKVYTMVDWYQREDRVTWWQEIEGQEIPGSKGTARLDASPWIPIRLFRVDGQSYGPGYVEAVCMADLRTADALSQAVAEGALLSAQRKKGVKPTSVSSAAAWAKAANGAYVPANEGDVFPIENGGSTDIAVAQQGLSRVEARLAAAFMLPEVRDSERTTAEEVRLLVQQIENALGSIYSILTVELLQPYVSRKLAQLTKQQGLPALPKGLVRPVVSVGLAAVGRGNDLERIGRFMAIGQQTLGDRFADFINPGPLLLQLANGLGLNTDGIIKSKEQLATEQQAAQQAAQAQALMASPMADPQKLATAAATAQEMNTPQPEPPAP